MTRIIVDARESRSGLAKLLEAQGAEVVVQELECGDFLLSDQVAVERKRADDFAASIMDRRIFIQLATLKRTYARAFFVVEGDLFGLRSMISLEALLGAMSWISVIENIPILYTSNTPQTATLLLRMQKHAIEGLGYEIALRSGKPKDRLPNAQYLVEGLVGVGPVAARKLLAHFGSAHAVMNASAEEMRRCPGMGPKTVAAIQEVLHFDTTGIHLPSSRP